MLRRIFRRKPKIPYAILVEDVCWNACGWNPGEPEYGLPISWPPLPNVRVQQQGGLWWVMMPHRTWERAMDEISQW